MSDSPHVLGWHWFLDLSQCQSLPADTLELRRIMLHAATMAKATIVDDSFHAFSPFGLSGVVIIAESHIAIHTWPEHHAACVDFFSCTEALAVEQACSYLIEVFQAKQSKLRCEKREIVKD